ncbi:MAG: glycosyltransferase [Flavobacterium sp.]|nr:glycosyltransferase [Flavobacterium sp.]
MEKIISVIVPVYNVEDYLPKCLDSILNQTFLDFELILIDDGSTDSSGKICDQYAQIDNRIKVIHQKNGGSSNARNAAIDIAIGKYYCFIDSDDWVDEQMLFEMYEQAILNNADIVIAGHFIVNLNATFEVNIKVKNQRILNRIEATSLILCDDEIHSFAWDKLYKRELFEQIRYPNARVFEDTATTYKLFNKAKVLVQMNKAYYYYLRRESGICLSSEFSMVIKRKIDNYLAFVERYEFTILNKEYTHIINICQEKVFEHGQQFLHYIVKNKLNRRDFPYFEILSKLSSIDFSKNELISKRKKLEHKMMKISFGLYTRFLQGYYYING